MTSLMMASQLDRVIMCPICLETMQSPILQCQTGHSMCGDCIKANHITLCPQCRGPLSTTRNYQLEQMIESIPKDLRTPCFYASKGCNYTLTSSDRQQHERECKNRRFFCEGKNFAKWKCEWSGDFAQLEEHMSQSHANSVLLFKNDQPIPIDLSKNTKDIKIISYYSGAHFFWYKHKVDVAKQMVYWTFQYVGTKKQAQNHYYEFEIYSGPIRKIKVTEICGSDSENADQLFDDGTNCVAVSFKSIRTFLDENSRLPIKYRIMDVKKNEPIKKPFSGPPPSQGRRR